MKVTPLKHCSAIIIVFALTQLGQPAFAANPGVDPQSVTASVKAGECITVTKTVHTPPIPPKPDIVFLADNTGSMGGAIANVQANASAILAAVDAADPDSQFGVASYQDFASDNCPADPNPFLLAQAITANNPDVVSGIGNWIANGGCDEPEAALNALFELATSPAVGYRSGSTKIIVWFGDAPGHDPSNGHTLAQVIAALQSANIRVIAVPVDTGGTGLDGFGQATAITSATGGVLLPSANSDQVAAAILAGLANLPVTVSATGACDQNVSVSISPGSQTVISGDDAIFSETICVRADAPQCGTVGCQLSWTLDGKEVLLPDGSPDSAFVQTVSITVPDVTPPAITCPANIVVCNDPGKCSAVVSFVVGATDNCAGTAISTTIPSGSVFPKGTTAVTATAVDLAGNASSCTFTVTVKDCESPVVECVPTTNPSGGNVPSAGNNPKSGQNPDGFYQLVGTDNCDGTALSIWVKDASQGPCGGAFAAGPYKPGDKVKLTQSPGQRSVKPMAGAIIAHINTVGEPLLVVTDSSGNTICHKCFVPPPPK